MNAFDWLIDVNRLCIGGLGGIVNFLECALVNTEALYRGLELFEVDTYTSYIL
jgi:hypothetical protein